jgi:capsular polysaccharide biosynthesis protein
LTFSDYVRVLRTYWKSIVLLTVIGAGVAVGATVAITPTYTATAQVLFTANTGTLSGQDLAYGATYTQSRMIAYQGLVKTPQVLGVVVSDLDLTETPTQLADHVSASFEPTSTLLTVAVDNGNAALATRIVRSVANSLLTTVSSVEQRPDKIDKTTGAPISAVTGALVTDPSQPTSPSSPHMQLDVAAGILLGLLLGLALAAIRFVRIRDLDPDAPVPTKDSLFRRMSKPQRTPKPQVAKERAVKQPRTPNVAKPAEPKRPGKRTRR